MKPTLVFACLLSFSAISYAQNKRTAELKLNYAFSSTGRTNKVVFYFFPPETIENAQKCLKVAYTPEPDTIVDDNGTNYAQFTLDSITGKPQIGIIATIEISQFDLNMAQSRGFIIRPDSAVNQYLQSERFIESDSELIRSAANRLSANTRIKTLRRIFNFTRKELKYTGFNWDEHGALFALETKGGDCNEFSDLFIALCRANDIPARSVFGFTTEYGTTPRHAWAEAYTNEYGWVRFDPTTGQALRFDKLRNIYIQLPNNRNNHSLSNGQYYTYRYWGDPIHIKETIDISKSLPHY